MNFGDLKSKVIRLLGDTIQTGPSGPTDPVKGILYSSDLLADGVEAALIAVTVRQWKTAYEDVTGGAHTISCDVPDGLLQLEGVYDNYYRVFMPQTDLDVDRTQFDTWGNAFILYPAGTITFLNPIQSGVRIYYSTYWTVPENDDDDLDTPIFLNNALAYYTAFYVLNKGASASANIRQFNSKVDSGQPDDNPLRQAALDMLKMYTFEMSNLPMMTHQIIHHRTGKGAN